MFKCIVWGNAQPINHDHFVLNCFTCIYRGIVDSPEDIFNWLEGHVSLTENEEHLQLEGIVPLSQETWYGCQGI